MPEPYRRSLRESDLFLAAGCCRSQDPAARKRHLRDFPWNAFVWLLDTALLSSLSLFFRYVLILFLFRSFDSRWIFPFSSSRLREFFEERFRLATILQSPAPYFFTFHTSHSLWEVRKHGTVARSSNLTHLNSGPLPERGPFSSIHPD